MYTRTHDTHAGYIFYKLERLYIDFKKRYILTLFLKERLYIKYIIKRKAPLINHYYYKVIIKRFFKKNIKKCLTYCKQ